MVSIIVDYQERRSAVPGQLERLGATVVAQRLEVGDYVLSPRVGVERKTAFDFVTAIIKKRFYLQVERLREAYPRPLYIIEGRQIYGLRDVHPNFVRGALATLTVDFAIPTLFTHGPDDTAALLFLIARREQTATGPTALGDDAPLAFRELPRGYRKGPDLRTQQLEMLEAIPLIGRHRAEQLLTHFGTFERLVGASIDELRQVPSIGLKTAARIKEILAVTFPGARSAE